MGENGEYKCVTGTLRGNVYKEHKRCHQGACYLGEIKWKSADVLRVFIKE